MIRTQLVVVGGKDFDNRVWIDDAVNMWIKNNPSVEVMNVSLSVLTDASGYMRAQHALITYRIPMD